MHTVRDILVQPSGVVVNALGEQLFTAPWPDGTVVAAKTGRGERVSWLVGHVEHGTRAWVFVSCVVGDKLPARASIDLAAASLRGAGVL
jgi:beta-lactamase class D